MTAENLRLYAGDHHDGDWDKRRCSPVTTAYVWAVYMACDSDLTCANVDGFRNHKLMSRIDTSDDAKV